MIRTSKDLTPQEKCLVVARHECPERIFSIHYRDDVSFYLLHGEKYVSLKIDYQTIGPIWDKYKERLMEWQITYRPQLNSLHGLCCEKKEWFDWYKSATLNDEVNVLIDYWYPDGIPEEMLR